MSLKNVYRSGPDDPYGLCLYTLSNGLTLFLSRRTRKPRIETRIVIRAGSSRDPENSTGAAHILEHLMFKGSRRIGAVSPAEEAAVLEGIAGLFDRLRTARGKEEKEAIFAAIDRENQKAAALALPGEYDRILNHIGARGVNAYTGLNETVYKCDIPSVELERWIQIEAERFSSPVMRSFLTEIEAIYEEFNQDQDDDFSRARELLLTKLFPEHPFGSHSILGRQEHIKAPSLEAIEAFRNRWYRPEQMALCLTGDFDVEQTAALIEERWGRWNPAPLPPEEEHAPAGALKKRERCRLTGPDSEFTMAGFRFGGIRSEQYNLLYMLDLILNNSQAGLIDLNLVQKQRLLEGGSSLSSAGEYSWFVLYGTPGPGQSLSSVHKLLLKQLDLIRRGEFDRRLPEGVVKYLEIERVQELETNGIVDAFAECFAEKLSWREYLRRLEDLRRITKEDLVAFAKENFKQGMIRIDKQEGDDPDIVKVEKPKISPVRIDYNKESPFFAEFRQDAPRPAPPVFPDYPRELRSVKLSEGVTLTGGRNPSNDLFELTFIFPEGKSASPSLPVAGDYFSYIGTDKRTPEELQKEAFFQGLDFSFQVELDRSIFSLFGRQEDFGKALDFLRTIIREGRGSSRTYRKFTQGLLKRRKDAKLSKRVLLFGGLHAWGLYGPDSPFRDILQEQELKGLCPRELTGEIRRLFSLPHHISYYGEKPVEEIAALVAERHPGDLSCPEARRAAKFYREKQAEGRVYFAHYDMVQAEVFRLAPVAPFDEDLLPSVSMYNEFFGSGLNSLVFQEIREARGLAYTAYSSITVPENRKNHHILQSFLGTQGDKLIPAVEALDSLLGRVPDESGLFRESLASIVKSQASERILDADIFWSWWEARELGLAPEFREKVFRELEAYGYPRMRDFFETYVRPAQSNLLVLGNRDEVDLAGLKRLGEFRELSPEELFNY